MSEHRTTVEGVDAFDFPCPYPDCDGKFTVEDTDTGTYDEPVCTSRCPQCEKPIEVVTHMESVAIAKPEAETDTYWLSSLLYTPPNTEAT